MGVGRRVRKKARVPSWKKKVLWTFSRTTSPPPESTYSPTQNQPKTIEIFSRVWPLVRQNSSHPPQVGGMLRERFQASDNEPNTMPYTLTVSKNLWLLGAFGCLCPLSQTKHLCKCANGLFAQLLKWYVNAIVCTNAHRNDVKVVGSGGGFAALMQIIQCVKFREMKCDKSTLLTEFAPAVEPVKNQFLSPLNWQLKA